MTPDLGFLLAVAVLIFGAGGLVALSLGIMRYRCPSPLSVEEGHRLGRTWRKRVWFITR